MNVVLGGVRGSWPVSHVDCIHYGGASTSLLVEGAGGERIVLDLGTGVRRLGERLREQDACDVLVLMTHYHLDHVIGLPAFPHLYSDRCRVQFAAPIREGRAVGAVLPRLLDDPFWPLQIEGMQAEIVFKNLPEPQPLKPYAHGGLEIRWTGVHHHAGCSAFRIDEPATGTAFLLATDIEWARSTEEERERFFALARTPRPVDLLCFDGHLTPEEYDRYRDWGHSTWREAVDVAQAVGARMLRVVHHAQFHTDRELTVIDAEVQAALPGASVAVEGSEIALP